MESKGARTIVILHVFCIGFFISKGYYSAHYLEGAGGMLRQESLTSETVSAWWHLRPNFLGLWEKPVSDIR